MPPPEASKSPKLSMPPRLRAIVLRIMVSGPPVPKQLLLTPPPCADLFPSTLDRMMRRGKR